MANNDEQNIAASDRDARKGGGVNRRRFMGTLGAASAVAGLGSGAAPAAPLRASGIGTLSPEQRQRKAYQMRVAAAQYHARRPLAPQPTNADESLPGHVGSFSKTLPHNNLGEVDPTAYTAYLRAIESGKAADFEAVPMGAAAKLANPQASYAFCLEGPDSHQTVLDPPPSFSSAELAAGMVEDYWLALTRDVAFADYGSNSLIQQAIADMSKLSAYAGPTGNGKAITPDVIFRGATPGDLAGPYVSQFLLLPIPYGMISVPQQYRVPAPGIDFVTAFPEWLSIQRGNPPSQALTFDTTLRYIRNGRDLSSYVHSDFSYQAPLNSALILNSLGASRLNAANPYKSYKTQGGFATFGAPDVLDMVGRVSSAALKATWNQKWLVHRAARPEVIAARLHNQVTGAAQYPLHSELLNSAAVQAIFSRYGTYLLPQAYPEASPAHPTYPAGHAALLGAGVTILKAFFDVTATIPNPMVPNADGTALVPYTGPALSIGGELNKLAHNIALGRDTAGVHFRTDGLAGLKLGEAVALGVLQDLALCYTEEFTGFTITRFDGTQITICPNCVA